MSQSASIAKRISGFTAKLTRGGAFAQVLNSGLGRTSYKAVGLNEKYPGVIEVPKDQHYEPVTTTMSTLPNGIRVVTRNTADPICNVALFVNAGSRYCSPDTSGIGHFLETLSTEGTNQIPPARFQENLARTGTSLSVQAFRDCVVYQCDTFKKHIDFALESVAELIWNARTDPWLMKQLHKEYLWRRGDVMKKPDHEVPEYMHQACYQGNTVGLPLYCDHNTIKKMTGDLVNEYIKVFYQPNRLIVVGTGVNHSEFERLAAQTFGDITLDPQYRNLESEKARYTGGQMKFKADFGPEDLNTHVALCFETENWHSPDLMALCVLNMIMGGGGSFSAGGPGKGMYTRLYRDVLGAHHWIHHISCSHSIFDDSGIFCIYGFTVPEHAGDLTGVIVREAVDIVQRPPNSTELERAKRTLASNICFEFENRHVVVEDLARQVHVYGKHRTPEQWREVIMAVTKEDVVRVAKKFLKSKPTLLALGSDVSRVPNVDEIETAIRNEQ